MLDARLPNPLAVVARLPRGAVVVFRPYALGERADGLAGPVAALCKRRRLTLLVAADWRLAARLKADGLHLPDGLARLGRCAPALGWLRRTPRLWLTTAAHSRPALVRAQRLGADAAVLSPVFPTASHPGSHTLGPLRFAALVRGSAVPVVALGGITPATHRRLKDSGAVGVAGISLFL